MRGIPLTKGFVALVDDEDYQWLARFRWHVSVDGDRAYAARAEKQGVRSVRVFMHRMIVNAQPGEKVDHRRHMVSDKLVDNRRENLRIASGSQNGANKGKGSRVTTSIFKGVSRMPGARQWRAAIERDGVSVFHGGFINEGHAALVYDLAAVEAFGEFAVTNFPIPGSTQWIFG